MTDLLVPRERLPRWVENFSTRHGVTELGTADGALRGTAADGSTFRARLPFDTSYDGAAEVGAFLAAAQSPPDWGVLLVRKGGFAVARLAGDTITDSKVGQRHVQGRTKAGGQSQQRFARRRDNQARQAYEAAGSHAGRILGDLTGPLVVGGDRAALDAVLGESPLRKVAERVVEPWLAVPDPRRAVLESAIVDGCSVRMSVVNAGGGQA